MAEGHQDQEQLERQQMENETQPEIRDDRIERHESFQERIDFVRIRSIVSDPEPGQNGQVENNL